MTDRISYSDAELQEFKELLLSKLEVAKSEYQKLHETLNHTGDHGTDDTAGKYASLDDGSETLEREQINQLAARQQRFIKNLEAALVRIENKTYGVCSVTGKLISKERLRAVPHTTQSMEAKRNQNK